MKINKKSILLIFFLCLLILFIGVALFKKNKQTIKKLSSNYQECKITGTSSVNDLICTIFISDKSVIFNECISNGGMVTLGDFSGESSCSISYYNFHFDKWPHSYKECIKVFGDKGGTGVCGEIIPRGDTYKPEITRVLTIRDNCLNNGGKNNQEGPLGKKLEQKDCFIGFKK